VAVEGLDGLGGLRERRQEGRLQPAGRRGDLRRRNANLAQVDHVEAGRVLPQGDIPARPDVVDYGADLRDRAFVHEVRSWEDVTEIGSAATKVETFQHGSQRIGLLQAVSPSRAEIGDDVWMPQQRLEPSELSELSSIASSLEQISRRVTGLADVATEAKRDEVAANLIAVERALLGAVRRLERLMASGR
jgi:hypothetical protein